MKRGMLTRRTPLRARRITKGGRGALPHKLDFLRHQRCDVCHIWPSEAHHDRAGGSRADDRRTVPLCAWCHRLSPDSVTTLGRRRFCELYGYDMDGRVAYWQERYEEDAAVHERGFVPVPGSVSRVSTND